MIWRFICNGSNHGRFNMDFDLELVRNFSGTPILRVYQWKPFCISLGANQEYSSVDQKKTTEDGFEIVKRPTGGRALLHAEELTYSVVYPVDSEFSPKQIYCEINLALKNGLVNYDPVFKQTELENSQPHFPSFYKDSKSTLCFAVSAKNELNFQGKKFVGSAQRKIGKVILQHGSILCGSFHKKIVNYLKLPPDKLEEIRTEIDETTTELETILGEEINYTKLVSAIGAGFENHFNISFKEDKFEETISVAN